MAGPIPKNAPYRNKAYLAYVRELPSAVTRREPCVAHHIIGVGRGAWAMKDSDLLTFPLTEEEHRELHDDVNAWERRYGTQWKHVALTLEGAMLEGVFR